MTLVGERSTWESGAMESSLGQDALSPMTASITKVRSQLPTAGKWWAEVWRYSRTMPSTKAALPTRAFSGMVTNKYTNSLHRVLRPAPVTGGLTHSRKTQCRLYSLAFAFSKRTKPLQLLGLTSSEIPGIKGTRESQIKSLQLTRLTQMDSLSGTEGINVLPGDSNDFQMCFTNERICN